MVTSPMEGDIRVTTMKMKKVDKGGKRKGSKGNKKGKRKNKKNKKKNKKRRKNRKRGMGKSLKPRPPVEPHDPSLGPAIDCMVSAWSDWGQCSVTCGRGVKTKTRMIKVPAENGGRRCPRRLVKTRKCKLSKCRKYPFQKPVIGIAFTTLHVDRKSLYIMISALQTEIRCKSVAQKTKWE